MKYTFLKPFNIGGKQIQDQAELDAIVLYGSDYAVKNLVNKGYISPADGEKSFQSPENKSLRTEREK